MSAAADLRVGWCPGALRPMMVGDGLLVRVKPRGNRLTIRQARAVAAAATRFGNGILTITARANLQVRGATEETLPGLIAVLGAEHLLDATPAGEAARNVLSSPLAGCDPRVFDIRPVVAALEDALVRDETFGRLPAKFNWTMDDGTPGLEDTPGDVVFRAVAEPGGLSFRVQLAGSQSAGACAPGDVVRAAGALAEAFLAACAAHGLKPHRMAELLRLVDADDLLQAAGLPLSTAAPPARGAPMIGALRVGAQAAVGVAPAFGRLEAASLHRFAVEAAAAGAQDLRLTARRGLLASGLTDAAAQTLLRVAEAFGLITDPADPRLAVAACAGQPACLRAGTPVQDHAEAWAHLLAPAPDDVIRLHVSGCAKGCAHAGPAPITLVARAGVYDLVREGRADDTPGARDLSVASVTAMLAARTCSGKAFP